MGSAEFEAYYRAVYRSRWDGLRRALLEERKPYFYTEGLLKPYALDRASALGAKTLRCPGSGTILDACAAPGGKSLVIASLMAAGTELLSNEYSGERRRRLSRVLDEHLPGPLRARVRVSGFDAAKEGGRKTEQGRFAAILLDAPCSSERHVLSQAALSGAASPRVGLPRSGPQGVLDVWSPARPRFLKKRQWALLSSAFLLLKEGGSLVYITCSLSPEENDGPVSRLLAKYKEDVIIDEPDFAEGEKTLYGRIILPDTAEGMGPLYVARFLKRVRA
ncbi:MAG: 16S rRNA methyltransferase [Spirochaetaceae bacterium]|jgi:16S rRNA (cytosine1407-C5)-methyltransferase|nr:16S rRNA methyltransferase [Spirochaetaceae bacterium]